jgi:hypothetical protein
MTDWISALKSEGEHATRLVVDFPYFAEQKLVLRDKAGVLVPFKLNSVQLALWKTIQERMSKTGSAKVAAVKARQQGLSSMCAGLAVWRMMTQPGTQGLIMGHRDDSASHVRSMIGLMIDGLDDKPKIEVQNASEMKFSSGSGFAVRVASEDSGSARGLTVRFAHLTEAAYFARWDDQMDALNAAIPDLPGVICVAETTADYQGSPYHRWYNRAAANECGDWVAWFAPWFLMDSYSAEPPADFEMRSDEVDLAKHYNLTPAKVWWRRKTLSGYSDQKRFAREMPATVVEAFASADVEEGFIPSDLVMAARKADPNDLMHGDLIIACDPAHKGPDRTVISRRKGRSVFGIEEHRGLDGMQVAGLLAKIIDKEQPKVCYLDSTGLGNIILDRLRERGYHECHGVNFASKPISSPAQDERGDDKPTYLNRRAEIYGHLRTALLSGALSLPDRDDLHSELCAIGYKYTSTGAVQLQSKDEIKAKKLGVSPDLADSVALLFAEGPPGTRVGSSAKPRGFEKGSTLNYPRLVNA